MFLKCCLQISVEEQAYLFHIYEWEDKFQKHDFTEYVLTGGYNFARDLFSLLFWIPFSRCVFLCVVTCECVLVSGLFFWDGKKIIDTSVSFNLHFALFYSLDIYGATFEAQVSYMNFVVVILLCF